MTGDDDFIDGQIDLFDPDEITKQDAAAERIEDDKRRRARADLERLTMAYRRKFGGEDEDAQLIRADLARFCRAKSSTYATDARDHALLEGRREVYLRMFEEPVMDIDELFAIKTGAK